ncbi:hypothetical protein TNCT_392731 [Trichonephila clavata]|uniref:Uncharacterized protein n=1 Tax=Trichonephila clavata TaxID=2740835 RepID=A0A8X6GRB3_TRICU|nr:hypothetical protein TNCT_392731 [Trichonephila clavata]
MSCQIAHYYAKWSGDINVPCRIAIIGIPGIVPTKNGIISYANLLSALELLGVANQEFIVAKNSHFDKNSTLKNKILESFVQNYMKMVKDLKYDHEDIEQIIKSLLNQMTNMFNDSHIFHYFLTVLCPYVKAIQEFTPVEITYDTDSPGAFFKQLSDNATEIRAESFPAARVVISSKKVDEFLSEALVIPSEKVNEFLSEALVIPSEKVNEFLSETRSKNA